MWSRLRIFVESGAVALVCFVLYLPYVSQPTFLDEFDNMVGGKVVADGGLIYQDYISQHTPFAYWFSAIGHLIGADGFTSQRLWGYGIFALALGLLYLRNAPRFGRVPVLATAVTMVTFHFANPDLSYALLSDNYQALCYVFLLFEVVAIGIQRPRTLSPWIVIAIASAVSVGTAFVSIYFVFVAVLASALFVVIDLVRGKAAIRTIAARIGVRAAIVAAPFVLFAAYFFVTGTAKDAFEQAYVMNTQYYSKYLGGFGSNPVSPLVDGFTIAWQHIIGIPQTAFSGAIGGPGQALGLIVVVMCVVGLIRLRPIVGIAFYLIFTLTTVRGWSGFHAQPLWAMFAASLGILGWLLFVEPRHRVRPHWATLLVAVVYGVLVGSFSIPYAVTVYAKWDTLSTPLVFPNPIRTAVIRTLVPADEKYGEIGINSVYDFIAADRSPAGGFAGVVPWETDMLESEMISDLAEDDPVLIFDDPSDAVWGFNIDDKAPQLDAWIKDHYERVDMSTLGITEGVYIRDDYVDTAIKKLEKHHFGPGIAFKPLPTPAD